MTRWLVEGFAIFPKKRNRMKLMGLIVICFDDLFDLFRNNKLAIAEHKFW